MRVYSISLGCPKNRVDTETLLGGLKEEVEAVSRAQDAELVLINTCAFIRPAVEESVRTILETAQDLHDVHPRPTLVVAGCLPARYGQEIRKELPEVDTWLLPQDYAAWPTQLGRQFQGGTSEQARPRRLLSTPPSYAYLKISDGCNHRCRYCTIPSIRGQLLSTDAGQLEREALALLEQGVSELVLVAQDLGAYGQDLGDKQGLRGLLERLLPLRGLAWLRLLYLYPSRLDEELLSFLRQAGPPLLPYFDIPLQHVHPAVLKAMGRPAAQAADLVVERVRAHFPEAALRTTFIVGFPGETETHFEALLRFVERQRLDHLGVFIFQPEEGTPAARLRQRVARKTAQRRYDAIMSLQAELSAERLETRIGDSMDVLVDAEHEDWPGLHLGRVWFQAPEIDGQTYVSGPGVKPGAMVKAEIMESKDYDLVALSASEDAKEEPST